MPRSEPYWRLVSEGAHLGYYRGAKVGKWVARYRQPGRTGGYLKQTLGEADDVRDADDERILTFKQADAAARIWFARCESDPGGEKRLAASAADALTVQASLEAYVAMRDVRASARAGRTVRSDAHRLVRHVKSDAQLIGVKLRDLSEADLKAWRGRLTGLKRSSRQRLVNDFKAALNATFAEHRRVLPADLPVTIKFGFASPAEPADLAEPVARENQILSDAQVREFIDLASSSDPDGDLALLVLVLAATGARFSQVTRMRVRDAQLDQSRLLVPSSRKGKGRSPFLIKVPIGSDVAAKLRSSIEGRPAEAMLLEHWRYKQVKPTSWERTYRAAWQSSSEMSRPWKRLAQEAGLPNIVPYALRHSSIVRGIRSGLPIRLVAALHDTSVVMIERHYSRWITEGLDDLAARAVIPLLAA